MLHQRGRCANIAAIQPKQSSGTARPWKLAPQWPSAKPSWWWLLAQERWADAIHELVPAEAEPMRLDLHSNHAVTLLRLNRLKEALTASDRCLELLEKLKVSDRDQADLWLNRGTILQELGNRTQARQATKRALQLNPDVANGHTNWGLLAHLDRDLDQAEQAYRSSISRNPKDTLARVNLAGVLLAQGGNKTQEGWRSYQQRLKGPAQLFSPPNGPQPM